MLNNSDSLWIGDAYPEPLRMFYIITGVLYSLFGVSSNVLIIVSILKVKSHRSYSNAFIVNIAATDVLLAGYILPITLMDLLQGSYPLPDICPFNGGLIRVLGMLSIFGKMMIAVSRFYQICHPVAYQRMFKTKKVLVFCAILWFVVGLIVYGQSRGSIKFMYDSRIHLCRAIVTDKTRSNIVYFCYVSVCIGVALFSYAKVYKKVKVSVNVLTAVYPKISSYSFRQNALDSVRINCIIFVVYILFITPDISLSNFEIQNVIARGIAANLRFAGTGISFIMYGALNRSISRTYKDLVCRLRCQCLENKVTNSASRYVESRNNSIFQIAGSNHSPNRGEIGSSMI